MGGEKPDIYRQLSFLGGSPPHGRGKACKLSLISGPTGITPAWAGKSLRIRNRVPGGQDHPRMGGEKHLHDASFCRVRGSPPHGRGKGSSSTSDTRSPGITPAWAGKSLNCGKQRKAGRDHPRMGGEKSLKWSMTVRTRGSPPHGRGKGGSSCTMSVRARITPAWAGKSPAVPRPLSAAGDHPRMGGEKSGPVMPIKAGRGSPPHGRGKVALLFVGSGHTGITPAWAGKRCRYEF